MRTKALLCAAAVAAGAVTAMAQSNVYSLNVVGYVNTQTAGNGKFQMIANPLNTTNNTIGSLLQNAPEGTLLFKWNGTGFDTATFAFGQWDQPNFTLNPGEGAFIQPAGDMTITWVGEVMQGNLTNNFPAGYAIRASMVPQTGTLTQLGLAPAGLSEGDLVFQFNPASQSYGVSTVAFGTWDSEATIGVGEAFWTSTSAGGTWIRNFTVQ